MKKQIKGESVKENVETRRKFEELTNKENINSYIDGIQVQDSSRKNKRKRLHFSIKERRWRRGTRENEEGKIE